MLEQEHRKGFTTKSFAGLIYSLIVLLPASIFSSLIAGTGLVAGVPFVLTLLMVEVARWSGSPLTRQESTVLFALSGSTVTELFFLMLLQQAYVKNISFFTWSFIAPNGQPLPRVLPEWYAPALDSASILNRTFISPDWVQPILVVFATSMLSYLVYLGYSIILYQMFVVQESLPFPIQQIMAETCTSLTEEEPESTRLLTFGAVVGIIYSFLLYFLPFMSNFGVQLLPLPFADWNRYVEKVFPGASLGISTDPLTFAVAMIIPLNVAVSMFIGAFSISFVGNYVLQKIGIFEKWKYGTTLALTYQYSFLYHWVVPLIGFSIAIAVVPILRYPKLIVRTFRMLTKVSGLGKEKVILPFKVIMPIALGANVALAAMAGMLTGYPVWIFFLLVAVWPLLEGMVAARGLGETGFSVATYPYFNYVVFAGTNAPVSTYFLNLWNSGAAIASLTGTYKMCDLTQTDIRDLIKGWIIIVPITWLFSGIFVQLLWTIAPIPSSTYPAVDLYWPLALIPQFLWATGGVVTGMGPTQLLAGFSFGTILWLACDLLHLPLSVIGVLVGAMSMIPGTVTILISGIVCWIVGKKMGKDRWDKVKTPLSAGIMLGVSIMIVIAVSMTMIMKAVWTLPF